MAKPKPKLGMTLRSVGLTVVLALLASTLCPVESEGQKTPCFEPIQVVRVAEPVYPIRSVASGTVILRIAVNTSGGVDHIDVMHGVPSLTEEAEQTVRKWAFQPARLDGKPVRGPITVSFGFSDSLSPGPSWVAGPQPEKASWFKPIQVVSTIGAAYPFSSVAAGTVVLQVAVGKAGVIEHVKVVHGVPSLTEEVEQTIRKWKFQPARLCNKPVSSLLIASFTFRVLSATHFTGQSHR